MTLGFVLTVLPEWMNTGIHNLYHCQLNEIFIKKGYRYAITNPVLGTIRQMNLGRNTKLKLFLEAVLLQKLEFTPLYTVLKGGISQRKLPPDFVTKNFTKI